MSALELSDGTASDEAERRAPQASAPRASRGSLAGIALVLGCLGVWQLVSFLRVGGRFLIAGPVETVIALANDPAGLALDLGATLLRAGLGLVCGTGVGIVLGLLLGAAALFTRVGDWLLDLGRAVPPVVWLPLCLLGFGYGDAARIVTISAGVAAIVAVPVAAAVHAPRSPRHEVLLLAGASWAHRLSWLQPWESLPALAVGVRVASSMAVVVATVTEMIAGAPRGIGTRLVSAQLVQDAAQLTACIVAVGVAGLVLSRALRVLERAARRFAGEEGAP